MTDWTKSIPPTSKPLRISGFTLAWITWFAAFLVIETWALIRKQPDDTWSEHWWSVFAVRRKVHPAVRAVLVAVQLTFGVWLTGHLAFGIWSW